ncbi:MAG: primosomal protein N' [Ignavibacteria bacterium]|nr:primosomal protein N' [Ignavibacteria bacterium]
MAECFVNIALNIGINKLFTYRVPDYLINEAERGKRVLVPFRKNIVTGVIFDVAKDTDIINARDIKSFPDSSRILQDEYLEFCKWLSEYYVSPIGELVFSGIPKKINIESDYYFSLNEDYKNKFDAIKKGDEYFERIYSVFGDDISVKLTKKQIENKLGKIEAGKYLNALLEKQVLVKERLYSKPVKEKFIKIINRKFGQEETEDVILKQKIKSEKQKIFLREICGGKDYELGFLINKTGISSSSVNSLFKKGLIDITEIRAARQSSGQYSEAGKDIKLNDAQKKCVETISESIYPSQFKVHLIFGVTGSGKTEVYIRLAKKVVEDGRQVIILVPEISLTPQLIFRFRSNFGNIIGVIHSRLPDGERLDTFDRIAEGKYKLVIGARSALFAPLKNPGLIIVDEEHDSSYKQESSPRYYARDAAIIRGRINNIPVVLGSATPSIESFYNAETGKYILHELPERATQINMPEISVIDLKHKSPFDRDASDKNYILDLIEKAKVRFLSRELIFKIDERLQKKESIILLQNRRGFHSYLECLDCGYVETCKNCSITLTYHKSFGSLKCHYCGFVKARSEQCSICRSYRIIEKGAGTEKVEEEIQELFKNAAVERLDSDSITSGKKFEKMLKDFYDKKIEILVGTQLISKGLDFPEVTLVGVINADIGLLNPDFRATEKTFQILTQVAGRSGRSEKKGEVLIQTNHPDYKVFEFIKEHNFKGYYGYELELRRAVMYPPFCRLSLMEIRSKSRIFAESKIKELFNFLSAYDKGKVLTLLTPIQPLFSKLNEYHRYHLLIKSSKEKDPSGKILSWLISAAKNYADKNFKGDYRLIIDIDVINLL